MPNPFLSDAWLDEVEALNAEAPEPPAALKDLVINVVVTGGPDGDKEVHMAGGKFGRGLKEGAPTKLTVPYETARAVFIEQNQQAAMQAFMGGQIKVEGDMTKLMSMQQAGAATDPVAIEIAQRLKAITAD